VFERIERTGQWLETSLQHLDGTFLVVGRPVALRDIYGEFLLTA
jgi:hypothetical protein